MTGTKVRPRPLAWNIRMHFYTAIQPNEQFMHEQFKDRSTMSMIVIPAKPLPNISSSLDRKSLEPRLKPIADLSYFLTGRSVQECKH